MPRGWYIVTLPPVRKGFIIEFLYIRNAQPINFIDLAFYLLLIDNFYGTFFNLSAIQIAL